MRAIIKTIDGEKVIAIFNDLGEQLDTFYPDLIRADKEYRIEFIKLMKQIHQKKEIEKIKNKNKFWWKLLRKVYNK